MVAPLFSMFDAEELDEQAAKLVAIHLAIVEFARPAEDDRSLFEAGIAKGLIGALAAWIVHPHQDGEQHEEALEGVIAALRAEVRAFAA